ncbi:hypothetical protein ES702_02419 [subsurface metagenome]
MDELNYEEAKKADHLKFKIINIFDEQEKGGK